MKNEHLLDHGVIGRLNAFAERCATAPGSLGDNRTIIQRAIQFAIDAHCDQERKYTGEPYVNHVFRVAETVATYCGNPEAVTAAILHDVVEDTPVTLDAVEKAFGTDVTELVDQLTDAFTKERYPHLSRAERKHEELNRLKSADDRAHTIKLADIWDNLRETEHFDPKFLRVYLQEKSNAMDVLKRGDGELYRKVDARIADLLESSLPLESK